MRKFNLAKIELSLNDKKNGLTLRTSLNPELAEFIGIMIGDGHLSVIERKNKLVKKFTQSVIYISCDKNEIGYVYHIEELFKSLFNLDLSLRVDNRSQAILLYKYSKGLVSYLSLICNIPIGRKTTTAKIPYMINNANSPIQASFLRGLADTDFYIAFKKTKAGKYSYPCIRASFRSRDLIEDIQKILSQLNFKTSTYFNETRNDKRFNSEYIMHNLYLNGVANLQNWIALIGTSHPKIQKRLDSWKNHGYYIPKNARK